VEEDEFAETPLVKCNTPNSRSSLLDVRCSNPFHQSPFPGLGLGGWGMKHKGGSVGVGGWGKEKRPEMRRMDARRGDVPGLSIEE